ncbi:MAG: NAD-dependent epimerase/dehydratase family protein [Candidatus Omnitrophica bacterium]|nr:NAD-dependent epimerase/dehydratase family protein [Candidatus Omnitrophota bacterium]
MTFCLESDIKEIADRLGEEAKAFSGRTILLSGGAGFLGRYFTRVFAYLNDQVLPERCRLIVCDNLITSRDEEPGLTQSEGLRFLRHDVIKPLDLDEPIDYIIQAAGIASPYYYRKFPLETLEVATIGTKQMLSLGLKHQLKGFLFFSSSEIYGDPDPKHVPTPESYRGNVSCLGPRACYDESKRLGETLCAIFHELHGVPTRMVRPFNIYGPGMQERDYRVLPNFASRIVGHKPLIIYGTGQQTRTFCYVTDAVTGFLKALLNGSPGQAYNIGNPVPEISMVELARTLGRVLNQSLEIRLVEYPDSYPADEPQRRCPDISKAALQLGYRPAVPLEEGLRRFLDWALRHYSGSQF